MMRPARYVAAALLLAGCGIGSAGRVPPRPVVQAADGSSILAGDFHVHAFPGDGALTPARLREEASVRNLDVVALTSHNQVLPRHLARWTIDANVEPLVLMGAEITHPDFHVIAVGITRRVEWNQPAAAVIDDVHAQGGVAIAAHPTRDYWRGWDDAAVARLDGVEVAHPAREESAETADEIDRFLERVRRHNPGVAMIGSSDFHASDGMGRCRTYLLAGDRSAAGVLEAIRAGRTVAEDANGRLFGDPALVQIVEARRQAGHAGSLSSLQRLAPISTWLRVAGLLLLPRSRRPLAM